MQRDHIKSWVPRQDITDRFNEHAQEWIKHTVWKEDCRSWYKNNDTGRVNAVWPGSSLQYCKRILPFWYPRLQHDVDYGVGEVIESPRYEDFDIEYMHKNPWAHLGMGYSLPNTIPESDLSPYIQVEYIDPKWLNAIGHRSLANEVQNEKDKKELATVDGQVRYSKVIGDVL